MILGTLLSLGPSACTFAVPSQNWQIQAVRRGPFTVATARSATRRSRQKLGLYSLKK